MRYCSVCFLEFNSFNHYNNLCKIGPVIILVLHVGKPRHSLSNFFSHMGRKWESQNLSLGILAPDSYVLNLSQGLPPFIIRSFKFFWINTIKLISLYSGEVMACLWLCQTRITGAVSSRLTFTINLLKLLNFPVLDIEYL